MPGGDRFVVLTHMVNERISRLIERARGELAGDHEIVVTAFLPDDADVPAALSAIPEFSPVRHSDILDLGYPSRGRGQNYGYVPGNIDLPLLYWHRQADRGPGRTWLFEGDVDFTGSLRGLVDHFDHLGHDLLATNVRPMPQNWANEWRSRVPDGWPRPTSEDTIALLPAFRVSHELLDRIDAFYRAGGDGHHEWTWPYAARQSSLTLADFRDFPLEGRRIYTSTLGSPGLFPGTFRFRPIRGRVGSRPNTLYHPVKDVALSPLQQARLSLTGFRKAGRSLLRTLARRASGKVDRAR